MTDLFSVVSGVPAATVEARIPPACRRGVDPAPPPSLDGSDLVVEAGPWRPRRPAHHLLPGFSALDPAAPPFRLEMSALVEGAWTAWVGTATIGAAAFVPIPDRAGPLACDVDVFLAEKPVEAVRLRVRIRPPGAWQDPRWMLALSVWTAEEGGSQGHAALAGRAAIEVCALSQMVEDAAIAARICSPTSVAMVLDHLGVGDTPARIAADVYHAALDLYGVWPAAIAAAGRRGVLGYLLRFPDWASAAWCLERGIPIIASIRYGRGQLAGAAIEETKGHLVVLTGYDGDHVLVNDPAAPTTASVRRRYRLDQFVRAWLGGSGVGYVLFKPTSA